jgi:hypothetical protein
VQTTASGNDPTAPSPYRASVATALGVVVTAVVALIGMFHPGFHLSQALEATIDQTLIPIATTGIVGLVGLYVHGHHKLEIAKMTATTTTIATDVTRAAPAVAKVIAAVAHTDLMASAGLTPAGPGVPTPTGSGAPGRSPAPAPAPAPSALAQPAPDVASGG